MQIHQNPRERPEQNTRLGKRTNRSASPEFSGKDKPKVLKKIRVDQRIDHLDKPLVSKNFDLQSSNISKIGNDAITYLLFESPAMSQSSYDEIPICKKGTPEIVGIGPNTFFPFSPSLKGDDNLPALNTCETKGISTRDSCEILTSPVNTMPPHRTRDHPVRFNNRPYLANARGTLNQRLRPTGSIAPLHPYGGRAFIDEVNHVVSTRSPHTYQMTLTSGSTRYFGTTPLPDGTHLDSFVFGPGVLAVNDPRHPERGPILTEAVGVTSIIARPQTQREVDIAEFLNRIEAQSGRSVSSSSSGSSGSRMSVTSAENVSDHRLDHSELNEITDLLDD